MLLLARYARSAAKTRVERGENPSTLVHVLTKPRTVPSLELLKSPMKNTGSSYKIRALSDDESCSNGERC